MTNVKANSVPVMAGQAGQAVHIPVLLAPIMAVVNQACSGNASPANKHYLDATFGVGGYSKALLSNPACHVTAIDRDPAAVALGRQMGRQMGREVEHEYKGRFNIIEGCFGKLQELLPPSARFDGILFDLGVSSPQLDQGERGFSFAKDGALDMRMSQSGQTAADLIASASESELAYILKTYGEERLATRIARAIKQAQQTAPITTTLELAELVKQAMPKAVVAKSAIHPATRTFQALRIAVNNELSEIENGLKAALSLLKQAGLLIVVSFHSLEDRIVKQFFNHNAQQSGAGGSRHLPIPQAAFEPALEILTRKPIMASDEEIANNPRSRSAKLRVARKRGRLND